MRQCTSTPCSQVSPPTTVRVLETVSKVVSVLWDSKRILDTALWSRGTDEAKGCAVCRVLNSILGIACPDCPSQYQKHLQTVAAGPRDRECQLYLNQKLPFLASSDLMLKSPWKLPESVEIRA